LQNSDHGGIRYNHANSNRGNHRYAENQWHEEVDQDRPPFLILFKKTKSRTTSIQNSKSKHQQNLKKITNPVRPHNPANSDAATAFSVYRFTLRPEAAAISGEELAYVQVLELRLAKSGTLGKPRH
jgi:hypothetical protein